MSKDEILELYLNIIYVGPNIYGVEAGSQYYFSKSAKDLTLEECAFLAGINNSPNSYNPFNKENLEKINKRTKTVLAKMIELKYINQEDYKTAISKVDEGLKFKKGKVSADDAVYSYHTDALLSQTIKDISDKKHISETFATNYINMAGLTIYSTQNSSIQGKMEKEFEKTKYQLKSQNGGEHSQAAMVLIDHKTGQVLGCVGGLGKKTTSRGLNRATQSIRQTGSCIKPIAVLVPGISEKLFTGATIFDDEQKEFADGYNPENYSKYLGNITVRRALESSQNIPFVEMMEEITPKTSMKYLKKMGIKTLSKWTKVNVAKVSITSAKNSKSKQILLKYKKISGIKGYEISYSTDKKFKKAVTRKNTTKTSYTISKLKKGKTYYVRIRAYKVDSTGKKVYGKYTSVKKVKVSK